jgi:hypothetical protein
MKGLPNELIYVLVVAAIVLFQYLMKRFVPQQQSQPPRDEPITQIPGEEAEIPATSQGSRTPGTSPRGSGEPAPSSAFGRRRFSRRSLMGTRRDMQNAIVIATILAPCRADEGLR